MPHPRPCRCRCSALPCFPLRSPLSTPCCCSPSIARCSPSHSAVPFCAPPHQLADRAPNCIFVPNSKFCGRPPSKRSSLHLYEAPSSLQPFIHYELNKRRRAVAGHARSRWRRAGAWPGGEGRRRWGSSARPHPCLLLRLLSLPLLIVHWQAPARSHCCPDVEATSRRRQPRLADVTQRSERQRAGSVARPTARTI